MFSGQESGEAENQTRYETAKCPGDMDDGTEDVNQSSERGCCSVPVELFEIYGKNSVLLLDLPFVSSYSFIFCLFET